MARPLNYDDQFTSLINSNLKQKFLFCCAIKVQSTAFYKFLNLQNGLRVCSVYDFFFGLAILYCGFGAYSFLNLVILCCAFFFCFFAFNLSNSLHKKFSLYYYQWRIVVLFLVPLEQLYYYNKSKYCYFTYQCATFTFYFGMTLGLSIIHLYLTKIAWSFYARLQLGQELLIIHGKYLEQMLNNEKTKMTNASKYIPPQVNKFEAELINFGLEGTVMDNNTFEPKSNKKK